MIKIYCSPLKRGDGDDGFLPEIKTECHEMVNLLLSDAERSPFLSQLRSEKIAGNISSTVMHQVNRAVQYLLVISPDVDTRKFVSICFRRTPALFPNWLRTLTLPDPKPSFSCLSAFSLIAFMLSNGPEVCLRDVRKLEKGDKKKAYDILIANVVPRALTKNIFTKAIQSPNPFMVVETLKLLSAVLKRFKTFATSTFGEGSQKLEYLAEKLAVRMPDLQVLLAIRSKFDPYEKNPKNGDSQLYRYHSFVTMNFCEVLSLYTSIFPNAFKTVQFEWVKLLSDSSETFLSAPLSLQHRLLLTVSAIYNCYEVRDDIHIGL